MTRSKEAPGGSAWGPGGPPLVSIVLPTYNGSRYLAESIASCVAQTYPRWELLVVDDASTDGTEAITRAFTERDPRITRLRHPRNRGLPAALNTGFAAARGEALTWTSHDNRYRPEALEVMVRFLSDHPRIDMVYTDYTVIDGEGRALRPERVREPASLLRGNHIGACFLYRRRLYELTGAYRESLALAEDYDYWLRASARCRLSPLHQDLYEYRLHESSLTSRMTLRRIHEVADVALGENLPALEWVPAGRKAAVYLRLARRSLLRHRSARWPRYLALAVASALRRPPVRTAPPLAESDARGPARKAHP